MAKLLNRYRFYVPENEQGDTRPVQWPPCGPCWCTGYGDDYHIWVAYADSEDAVLVCWPDAYAIDEHETDVEPQFSSRFPQPAWWTD